MAHATIQTATPAAMRACPHVRMAARSPVPVTAPDVNPHYAAFAASLGHDATLEAVQKLQRNVGNLPFMMFMGRCRTSAPRSMFTAGGSIIDRHAWTAHVWSVATSELLSMAA